MKALVSGLAAVAVAGAAFAAVSTGAVPVQANRAFAFTNANVVPMDQERVLSNYTVVVRNGRIVDLGPANAVSVPSDAQRIAAGGKYLMPGLSEMHGHTPVPDGDPTSSFVADMMFLYAANGVTTVRGMLGGAGQLELRAMVNRGELIGPTLYVAGPSFNGGTVTSPEQGAQRVRDQRAEGWDLLKIHPQGFTRENYDAVALAAHEVGIRFGGHVPPDVGLIHAIQMGQLTFDHLDGYLEYTGGINSGIDQDRLAEVVRLTREAGAAVVPTMVLWEIGIVGLGDVDELRSRPEMQYWPRQSVDGWARNVRNRRSNPEYDVELARLHAENRNRTLKALSDGGATILMGTDSPQMFSVPGFSLHREMQAMIDAGMSTYEVLASGTRNVGEYFQGQDGFGTIAVGRRADLILTNSNPLDDVANVADRAGVMVRGNWLPEEMIQQRLAEIAATFANQ